MKENILLEVDNISKEYYTASERITIYKNYNMTVEKCEIVAIIGPSGCGKSTLLNIMSGIDIPDSGRVLYNQKNLIELSDRELSNIRINEFGCIFQDFNLLSTLSVIDNILVPIVGAKRKIDMEAVLDLCKSLGIDERLYHFPYQLSGGEKQRVAIARALVNQPKIVFSDEATGNLDADNSKQVMELLVNSCRKNNASLVYVTHDSGCVKYADTIIDLAEGRLYE